MSVRQFMRSYWNRYSFFAIPKKSSVGGSCPIRPAHVPLITGTKLFVPVLTEGTRTQVRCRENPPLGGLSEKRQVYRFHPKCRDDKVIEPGTQLLNDLVADTEGGFIITPLARNLSFVSPYGMVPTIVMLQMRQQMEQYYNTITDPRRAIPEQAHPNPFRFSGPNFGSLSLIPSLSESLLSDARAYESMQEHLFSHYNLPQIMARWNSLSSSRQQTLVEQFHTGMARPYHFRSVNGDWTQFHKRFPFDHRLCHTVRPFYHVAPICPSHQFLRSQLGVTIPDVGSIVGYPDYTTKGYVPFWMMMFLEDAITEQVKK